MANIKTANTECCTISSCFYTRITPHLEKSKYGRKIYSRLYLRTLQGSIFQ